MSASVFESVTRRGYWIGIAVLMVVLSVLAFIGGFYVADQPEVGAAEHRVETLDPLTQFMMYNPVGVVVVTLVLQFLAANVLFWLGAWVWVRLTRRGEQAGR